MKDELVYSLEYAAEYDRHPFTKNAVDDVNYQVTVRPAP